MPLFLGYSLHITSQFLETSVHLTEDSSVTKSYLNMKFYLHSEQKIWKIVDDKE